jgi:uncharacterized protein (UPF0276 family)
VEHAFQGELSPGYVHALNRASARGDLVGHAVMASPMTTPRDGIHHDWLRRTKGLLERWPVRWLTDHFGVCRADRCQAAPMPLPASKELVQVVRDHLSWVRDELQVQVGLENLALAFSVEDVLWQPDLVDAMVRPVGGTVLLDLHNLWCQAINFDLDPVSLIERWPLDLVKELHVAGGSWSDFASGRLRRDTHDGPMPSEVLALVPEALARCPNAEVVTFERLRGTVHDAEALRQEVRSLVQAVQQGSVRQAEALPAAAPWRSGSVEHVANALFHGARDGNFEALDRLEPGWATDPRGREAAQELLTKWGRDIP